MVISLSTVVMFVFYLIIAAAIFWLLNFLIDYVAFGEPFTKIAKVVLVIAAVFVLIGFLLQLAGQPIVNFTR